MEEHHAPFDVHDPADSPQGEGTGADVHTDKGADDYGQAGHFDATGHVTGTMSVRGRTFEVGSVERMDHSWGPRDTMKVRIMFIVSATMGPDLAFHMICPWEPDTSGPGAFQLTHGYVVERGEVYGLTSDAEITAQHLGLICTGMPMKVTDVRGRSYELEATADIGAPWIAGSNAVTHNALMRWTHEGRHGCQRWSNSGPFRGANCEPR